MEDKLKRIQNAYSEYVLNSEHRVNEYVFKQIGEILKGNKQNINNILKLNNRRIRYNDIENMYNKVKEEGFSCDIQINMKKMDNNFVNFQTYLPTGILTVESDNILDNFRCMLNAVKNRNGLVITSLEYNELDDKHYLLLLVQKALKMYNISEELIQILPYEEWDEKMSDNVIYSFYSDEVTIKEKKNIKYIYIQDDIFKKNADFEIERLRKNRQSVEVIESQEDVDDAINQINKYRSSAAVIYTQDPKVAYKFIKLVQSDNVFVNASLEFEKQIAESTNIMLINKNIMYELKSII